ncbi:MAG: hypothetical protein JKY65_16240 [Planctomycetes bacterium]|nr:hypothetical protein [Planctomycetota bacterium]
MKRCLIVVLALGGFVAQAGPYSEVAAKASSRASLGPVRSGSSAGPTLERDLQTEVFWVEGRLAARAILEDTQGGLLIEGSWRGVASGSLRLPAVPQGAASWTFSTGRGGRLILTPAPGGTYRAEILRPGLPPLRERWIPSGPARAELRVGSGASRLRFEIDLAGSPLDLELAIVSKDPTFRNLSGLVYLESLGRLPVGQHALTWSGRDRSAAARRVPRGRYRVELRERRFLPAPGVSE